MVPSQILDLSETLARFLRSRLQMCGIHRFLASGA